MRVPYSRLVLPLLLAIALIPAVVSAQEEPNQGSETPAATAIPNHTEPIDANAKKTYDEAVKFFKEREYTKALDSFRKANKQDGGRCIQCELKAWTVALTVRDFKTAREEANQLMSQLASEKDKAEVHYMLGCVYLAEGIQKHHDNDLQSAHQEFQTALNNITQKSETYYNDGVTLAYLKQDDEAKASFQSFLNISNKSNLKYERATRFAANPELARLKLAPNFRLNTLDGKTLTLDSFAGKVVLIDFWATWCGPCVKALPHIKEIARKFDGQPLVILSISFDNDDAKWKDFVGKNQMTWFQARDGEFTGPLASLFDVDAIPATFTIDAEGVLQDQQIGDADIEGKIKKLIARAIEMQKKNTRSSPGAGN